MDWLKREAEGKAVLFLMGMTVFIDLTVSVAVALVFQLAGVSLHRQGQDSIPIQPEILLTLLVVAFIEECMFRLPLALLVKWGVSTEGILGFAVLSSALFGYMHGGFTNIFLQGVSGFLYSILFLKAGGLQNNFTKALMVVTFTHYAFNTIVVCIIVLIGGTAL